MFLIPALIAAACDWVILVLSDKFPDHHIGTYKRTYTSEQFSCCTFFFEKKKSFLSFATYDFIMIEKHVC